MLHCVPDSQQFLCRTWSSAFPRLSAFLEKYARIRSRISGSLASVSGPFTGLELAEGCPDRVVGGIRSQSKPGPSHSPFGPTKAVFSNVVRVHPVLVVAGVEVELIQ